mmetsp:Transcript_71297/g.134344  ORF Transcript_71297/g.134344 Transcript_71297/m.134344 type:complete len:202 (-) Transcript_71297:217-822(-)
MQRAFYFSRPSTVRHPVARCQTTFVLLGFVVLTITSIHIFCLYLTLPWQDGVVGGPSGDEYTTPGPALAPRAKGANDWAVVRSMARTVAAVDTAAAAAVHLHNDRGGRGAVAFAGAARGAGNAGGAAVGIAGGAAVGIAGSAVVALLAPVNSIGAGGGVVVVVVVADAGAGAALVLGRGTVAEVAVVPTVAAVPVPVVAAA